MDLRKNRGWFLFLTMFLICTTSAMAQLWPVAGQVTDLNSGVGVDGATVYYSVPPGLVEQYMTVTALGGFYGFIPGQPVEGLATGIYVVNVVAEGYEPFEMLQEVLPGPNEVNISLTPLTPLGNVGGTVTDFDTNLPVIGATVEFGDFEAVTAGLPVPGGYAIQDIPAAEYEVTVSADGYQTLEGERIVVEGNNIFNFALRAELPLANAGGVVIDAVTTFPVVGAMIQMGEHTTFSLENGLFGFLNIPAQLYNVIVTATGYETYMTTVTLVEGNNELLFTLVPGEPEEASVGGQITDNDTGLPLVGVEIFFNDISAVSNEFGIYGIPAIPAGPYSVNIIFDGYNTYNDNLVLDPGVNVYNAALTPAEGDIQTLTYFTFFQPYLPPPFPPMDPVQVSFTGELVLEGEEFIVPNYDLTQYPMLGESFQIFMDAVAGTRITAPVGSIDQNLVINMVIKNLLTTLIEPYEIIGIATPDPNLEGQLWMYTEYQVFDELGNRLNGDDFDFYFNDGFPMVVDVPIDPAFGIMMAMLGLEYEDLDVAFWDAVNEIWMEEGITAGGYLDEFGQYWFQYTAEHFSEIAGGPAGGFGEDLPSITLPLQENYFELVSLPLVPEDLNAESVFGEVGNLQIVYEDNGSIYVPSLMMNSIGDIDFTEGYSIFCDVADELTVTGPVLDFELEFNVSGNIWNWIGYPMMEEIPIDWVMGLMADQIEIVMTDDGRIWIPSLGMNSIGNMAPGEGYLIFPNTDLVYPYVPEAALRVGACTEVLEIPQLPDAPAATGLPYAVLVRMSESLKNQNPATIEIYDGSTLVGKALVLDDYEATPVIAWQGSAEHNLAGFVRGNEIMVKIQSSDGNEITAAQAGSAQLFGQGAYADITLNSNASVIPQKFEVAAVYPNPFNPSVTIPFSIPETGMIKLSVYNTIGQLVYNSSRNYETGKHTIVFNASDSGSGLVSGMYFLQINYKGQVNTQKIMLMK